MGTITKALTMLNLFSSQRSEIGLASFVRLTGRDKATVRRHLVELEENGFLEQNPISRSYRLGPAVLRLASVRELHFPARSVIAPIVEQMASELGELVHASQLQGEFMTSLYHADPKVHGMGVIFDESELLPLHATASGLAMLAFGPADLEELTLAAPRESFTAQTVVGESDLLHLIQQARLQGYSHSDQLFTSEIQSFAMPFFGPNGIAVGAIAVPLPQSRLDDAMKKRLLAQLRFGCEAASKSFGGTVPDAIRQAWGDE